METSPKDKKKSCFFFSFFSFMQSIKRTLLQPNDFVMIFVTTAVLWKIHVYKHLKPQYSWKFTIENLNTVLTHS